MFSGYSDRLDEGLYPFRTVYDSVAKNSAAISNLQTYDLLATEGTLSLGDIRLFQHVLKSKWPKNFLQLDTSIKLFYNLIAVLFTTEHPLCTSYRTFITFWDRLRVPMSEYFSVDPAKPAQFLRSLQLSISVYWETVSSLDHNLALLSPAPDLIALIQAVRTRSCVPPPLPGFVPPIVSPLSQNYTHIDTIAPTSPPTEPTLTGTEQPITRQSVTNLHRHPNIIAAMDGRRFRFRDLLKTCAVPKTKDGRDIWCLYQLRGHCFDDCGRKNTHQKLGDDDVTSLREFVKVKIVDAKVGEA